MSNNLKITALLLGSATAIYGSSASADTITLKPSLDARLRYENVDTPTVDADAVTIRLRPGITASTKSGFSVLVEGEGTLAIGDHYRGAPFLPANGYAVVSDPDNVELNRLQLQYKSKALTATVGRQRINLSTTSAGSARSAGGRTSRPSTRCAPRRHLARFRSMEHMPSASGRSSGSRRVRARRWTAISFLAARA
jgi:hypothetical protein